MVTETIKVKEIKLSSMNEEQAVNDIIDIMSKDLYIPGADELAANITFEKIKTYSCLVALYQGHTIVECMSKETDNDNTTTYYRDTLDYNIQHIEVWKSEEGAPDIELIKTRILKENVIDISKYPDVKEMHAEEYIKMSSCSVDDISTYNVLGISAIYDRPCTAVCKCKNLGNSCKVCQKFKVIKPFYESPIPCIMHIPYIKWKYKNFEGISLIDPRDGKIFSTAFPYRDFKPPIWARILSILIYSGLIIFPILWFKDVLNFFLMLIGMLASFFIAEEVSLIGKSRESIPKILKKRYIETTK